MFVCIKKSIAIFLQIALVVPFLVLPHQTVQAAATTIFLTDTSATTWTVPSDWNSSNNTIEVIGGGAGGSLGLLGPEFYGVGGGGGAYSKVTNVSLTGGATVGIQVGNGGAVGNNGEDTWLCNSTSNCASIAGSAVVVGAKAGTLTSTGGTGGAAASGVGTVKYSGGNGAIAAATFAGAGGGGGAAGPNGNGGDGGLGGSGSDGGGGGGNGGGYNGADATGSVAGAGGNNYSNTGGGSAGAAFGHAGDGTVGAGGGGGDYIGLSSGDGGNGMDWDETHGSGGGGGGGPGANQTDPYDKNYGGKGGLYGGGGGGSPMGTVNSGDFAGGQGIIVITYTPSSGSVRSTLSRPLNNLGLLAYYSMNEGSGTGITDFSGNGRTGTFENTPTWVAGKRGKALSFNGTSQSIYLAGGIGNFSIPSGGGMTVSAWVKTSDDNGAVVSFRNGSNGSPVLDLVIGSNGLTTNAGHFIPLMRYDAGDGLVEITSTKRIDDGLWHHVVAVVDQANNLLKAYVDGVEYSTAQNNDGVLTFGNDEIAIGVEKNWANNAVNSNDQQYLESIIDEVRIYSRALSLTEVRGLYGTGAVVVGGAEKNVVKNGLVAHWTFNGNDVVWSSASAGTAYDRVGGNNGTLTNMNQSTSPTQGKMGQALGFDGVDDYVEASASDVIGALTSSAWVYLNSNTTDQKIIGNQNNSSGGYKLGVYSDGKFEMEIRDISNEVDNMRTEPGGTALSTGRWYHVVGTYDDANNVMITYVDGALDRQMVANRSLSASGNVVIGKEPFGAYAYFNGLIDDVRIYNRTLSAGEVKQLYRMGSGTVIRQN